MEDPTPESGSPGGPPGDPPGVASGSLGNTVADGIDDSPKLVFRTGCMRGTVLALEKNEITIGRDGRNDISIDIDIISGFHTRITRDAEGRYWLEDRGSKNGTFLDGKRIERRMLQDGDVFCICSKGPEVQFTAGEATLPTLLESTTSILSRTKSVESVIREIIPRHRGADSIMNLSGVRQVLDYKLRANVAKERRFFVLCMGLFLFLAVAVLGVVVVLVVPGHHPHEVADGSRDPSGAGQTASSAASLAPAASQIRLIPALESIYGSLYFTYHNEDSSIGTVTVRNEGTHALAESRLVFGFDEGEHGFLDEPFQTPVPAIPPGGELVVRVSPKLSGDILSDSNRRVTAQVTLLYQGKELVKERRAVLVYKRDVFNWQDPQRIAIFVDPDDHAVSLFLKKVWPSRARSTAQEFPPPNVVKALTLLTALADLELSYIRDAKNPIAAAMDQNANDRVNFPVSTFLDGFGDCDDLAVLGCALLEAIRIPTAFAVGNGHVLFLFDTGIKEQDLDYTPFERRTIILHDGRVWMPIESTDLARAGANFASAWAASWRRRESIESGEMEIIEVSKAWKKYIPMNQPVTSTTRQDLRAVFDKWTTDSLAGRIATELRALRKLFQKNLESRIKEIEETVEGRLARQHAVGLLYAKTGLYGDARRTFAEALFGTAPAPDLEKARRLLARVEPGSGHEDDEVSGEAGAVLLSNLATCMTLSAGSGPDLARAAAFMDLAIEKFPEEAESERGELLLRLALIHRLKGDLSEEKRWLARATEIDASLDAIYRTLVASGGAVAGPEEKILEHLRVGMRTALLASSE